MMSNYFLSMNVERMNNQDSICDPSDSNPNPNDDPYYCTLICGIWSPVSSLQSVLLSEEANCSSANY